MDTVKNVLKLVKGSHMDKCSADRAEMFYFPFIGSIGGEKSPVFEEKYIFWVPIK